MRPLQKQGERDLPKENFSVFSFGGKVLQAVDPVPEMPGVASRGSPLHQQRLSHLLHEEEDPDRAGRARQDTTAVRKSSMVEESPCCFPQSDTSPSEKI